MRVRLLAAVSALCMSLSGPVQALTFVFNDIGGVSGTRAAGGFVAAAKFWQTFITNDVTVRIDVGFSDLGENVLGSTGSRLVVLPVADVKDRLFATGSNTGVDQAVRNGGFPTLTPGQFFGLGAVDVVTPGYVDEPNQLGIDVSKAVLDTDGSFNNSAIALSTANAKAIGFEFDGADAEINFSSTFPFDFDARDGIAAGQYDFLGVAIHEIGHALGFLSGADDYDFLGCPAGPACGALDDYPVNDEWWGYALDLFRYSRDFDGQARLDWRPGVDSYFSLDGGATPLFGDGYFSEGSFNGDGWQASHWKAPEAEPFCTDLVGIMNPYLCNGRNSVFTSLDFAAFDAIGWNVRPDVLDRREIRLSSRFIAELVGVPEPQSWAMLIAGFGLVGATMRRRARQSA